jgi:hypothetical protein
MVLRALTAKVLVGRSKRERNGLEAGLPMPIAAGAKENGSVESKAVGPRRLQRRFGLQHEGCSPWTEQRIS